IWPLILAMPEQGRPVEFKRNTQKAVTTFIEYYKSYFARHNARVGGVRKMIDPQPRVVLVPGLGLFGLGRTSRDAMIAADIATCAASVRAAFDQVVAAFGGVDIVVSNAGAAWQGRIGEVDEEVLRKSFELNFYGHQRVAQAAVKIMLAQSTGGCLLFNVSKQAVNPGVNFGPYGLPKAATLLLVRQYALEYGADGIRSNGVNADRIRSGLMTNEFIAERAKARGVSEKEYMRGNLLQREVTADDVAQAFVSQALALKTTADVTTVDGGNIAAALR